MKLSILQHNPNRMGAVAVFAWIAMNDGPIHDTSINFTVARRDYPLIVRGFAWGWDDRISFSILPTRGVRIDDNGRIMATWWAWLGFVVQTVKFEEPEGL